MTDRAGWAPTSFGARAHDYDRLRPGYPLQALTEALAGGPPGTALDIGCGTGKLATALAALGHEVTGVEPDTRMAEVASANGLAVEVGAFETWESGGRRFDLVACGQAWHWLRPGERTEKALRCLGPAGRILLAWNFGAYALRDAARLNAVYASVLPDGLPAGSGGRVSLSESDLDGYAEELRSHGFQHVTRTAVPWQTRLTSRQFCELLATESRHLALPEAVRRRLLGEVAAFLDAEADGGIGVNYTCLVVGASAAG
ncbi:class I SAM-dependent methyltransferase [Streptomyces alanosinicus]|uniref:Methyltransferase type 11 n=1 Tax=Streptomyces alanosinicus TaxID=68171 RepID=A0A918YRU6_9ACTN|nr:class I SAM-dependent methyltransferase [Streptomyces alanosinicus]GHE14338.1 methyltransferase type 11 [Streptomyces alanosinicus]